MPTEIRTGRTPTDPRTGGLRAGRPADSSPGIALHTAAGPAQSSAGGCIWKKRSRAVPIQQGKRGWARQIAHRLDHPSPCSAKAGEAHWLTACSQARRRASAPASARRPCWQPGLSGRGRGSYRPSGWGQAPGRRKALARAPRPDKAQPGPALHAQQQEKAGGEKHHPPACPQQ